MTDSDDETLEEFRRARLDGDARLRDALVERHLGLAHACAQRFAGKGEQLDDLRQVAAMALVKAVDRFDPDRGYPFSGFAVPTIMGELRRHFRDRTWGVQVPRRIKDLHVRLPATADRLSHELGRSPTVSELASDLGCGVEEALEALDAAGGYRPTSLEATPGAATDRIGGEDASLEMAQLRSELLQLLAPLDERERRVLFLRFYEERSQSEIAEVVGVSQVHVSRIIRGALARIRTLVPEDG